MVVAEADAAAMAEGAVEDAIVEIAAGAAATAADATGNLHGQGDLNIWVTRWSLLEPTWVMCAAAFVLVRAVLPAHAMAEC
jgi:hypothetical protein